MIQLDDIPPHVHLFQKSMNCPARHNWTAELSTLQNRKRNYKQIAASRQLNTRFWQRPFFSTTTLPRFLLLLCLFQIILILQHDTKACYSSGLSRIYRKAGSLLFSSVLTGQGRGWRKSTNIHYSCAMYDTALVDKSLKNSRLPSCVLDIVCCCSFLSLSLSLSLFLSLTHMTI